MKDYEICRRITPLSTSKLKIFIKKLFRDNQTMVKCFVIRTEKSKEEILNHYGGTRFVEGITECTRVKNQETPII